MKALLFGQYAGPPQGVPALLGRAGFEVHALTTDAALGRCRQLASCRVAASFPAMLRQLLDEGPDRYDLIVVGDDATLLDLKTADIALVDKLTILPIMDERDLGHIASKIGLSHTLKAANISVPAFRAADHRAELAAAVEQLGFPLFIKQDFGRGGAGVFEIDDQAGLDAVLDHIRYPVLVQEKIAGQFIDLSGFFHHGEPVFFSYSKVLVASHAGLGPSSVRRYRPAADIEPQAAALVRALGAALGANGFANISCMKAASDGRLYCIEADMRPNVWVEYPKYFNEDPAVQLRGWLGRGRAPTANEAPPVAKGRAVSDEFELGFLPRMGLLDIALNRYRCRTVFENYLRQDIVRGKLRAAIARWAVARVKPRMPRAVWTFIRQAVQRW